MNVELHQLDLRYEKLRTHKPEAERKLVGSLAGIGQPGPGGVGDGAGPGEGATALEQGWLLHELTVRFELSLEDLGRRFARSASWVSRRLALVGELPAAIQAHVQRGELPGHAAMKHLVPLARANAEACATACSGACSRPNARKCAGSGPPPARRWPGWLTACARRRPTMLEQGIRQAILELHRRGAGLRGLASPL